jgi:hypothetical protein
LEIGGRATTLPARAAEGQVHPDSVVCGAEG